MSDWRPDGRGWWERRDGAAYALTRRMPPRWDVMARTCLPDLGRRRLAHAVRQDMWRALQRVRGFSPLVEVVREDGLCHLRAGGRVEGPRPPDLPARIQSLLDDPRRRAAWARAAAHRGAA
ncbi:hypothetical protein [Jannaschia seohaensis]|uniref:Uncharacterized protein n=1 Tax=Jannaschia seohaensis TaxID=475081 RepID=A0A2Y9C876_9RHOB|nr:hypothetical protein [Jannaschia seohaensis]PWJ16916.1 hypothetical protein BCF38_10728 [Jannaschia seohaensis]SSA48123.1 hypothetical protein SAMN05421539_10728 [Jannaschia seohaensis]